MHLIQNTLKHIFEKFVSPIVSNLSDLYEDLNVFKNAIMTKQTVVIHFE